VRYLFSLLVAMGVVFGLFLVMEQLVEGARWKPENVIDAIPIEFVRVKREEAVQQKKREIPKPPEPRDEPPPPPTQRLEEALQPPGLDLAIATPKLDTSGRSGSGLGSIFDAQTTAVIPLARVIPQYPRQAQSDGIEGWVEVEFTITEFGTVEDPRVLRSEPRGVFENAALRAIIRWKFKPKVENGVPVRFRGSIRLEFNLEGMER
jgi:protein TonB